MQPGDVITQINGRDITGTHAFTVALAEIPAGDQARLAYWRGGAAHHAALIMEVAPRAIKPNKPKAPEVSPLVIASLGISVITHPQAAGLIITSVVKGSPAAKAGIDANSLIEAIGPDYVTTPAELRKATASQVAAKPGFVTLLIGRPKGMSWVPVKLASPPVKPAAQPS